jgi:hypothetical protein
MPSVALERSKLAGGNGDCTLLGTTLNDHKRIARDCSSPEVAPYVL